jgi:N-carbamoylputrescine amidase
LAVESNSGGIQELEMAKSSTRVALIQMSCEASTEANLKKAVARVREAAENGARLVCLPELFRAQYFCQREDHALFNIAESIPGPSTKALSEVVREHKLVLIASLFERRAPGLYHNTAAVLDCAGDAAKDNVVALYRKMHIPDDPLYFEKFYFTPGDLGFLSFDTAFARVGVLVCWDQWYPEAARLSSLGGPNVLFYPTAIGWHPAEKERYGAAQLDAWKTIQRAHAIANGIYVAAVNRVGFEGPKDHGLEFWGSSFVADPFGQVIAEAPSTEEAILIAECDPHRVEEVRRNWPFLRDRRIDAYSPILKRWLD